MGLTICNVCGDDRADLESSPYEYYDETKRQLVTVERMICSTCGYYEERDKKQW